MKSLSKQLDELLLDLGWSLWTELGVAGIKRKHQNCLISIEELVVLTVALMDVDPRLRDESLDWCSQYFRFISVSRLKSVLADFSLDAAFSSYAATLNSLSSAKWPNIHHLEPLKVHLSHKSCLRPLDTPALMNIRARSVFGVGARADLISFFLMRPKADFSASDLVEIGYTKRNLASILDEFCISGIFDKFPLRNQQRYRMKKNDHLIRALGPIPEYAPSWQVIFAIILPLRDCLRKIENSSESSQVVEIRNYLIGIQEKLQRLNLTAPTFQNDFPAYLNAFSSWITEFVRRLSQCDFPDESYLRIF